MADHTNDTVKDLLKDMTSRRIRLAQGPALVVVDSVAKVMYVVPRVAPVRVHCISLALRFEPIDFAVNKAAFAPKKVYLADRGNYLVVVGNTQIVAIHVCDFLRDPNAEDGHALKSHNLIVGVNICDCCPYRDSVLILTPEALLKVDLSVHKRVIPEEIAYFSFEARRNPLKVFVKTPLCYWVLFDDNSIGFIQYVDKRIKLKDNADDFAIIPGTPDTLVTFSQSDKTLRCYYILFENPSPADESDIVLFAQVDTGASDVSLLPIQSGVLIQSSSYLSALTLTNNHLEPAGGLSSVYTPIASANSLSISDVDACFDPMERSLILGLSDGTIHFIDIGTRFSPLEVGPHSEDDLIPPQKVIFDPRKESPAAVARETLEKLVAYMEAVVRDSNARTENIKAACVESAGIIKAIERNLERIKATVDRNEQRIRSFAGRRNEINARYESAIGKEEYEALYAKFTKIKEEFTRRQEEYEKIKHETK